MTPLHPKKLLLTKWTAVRPSAKNKHFFVSKVIEPEPPEVKIELIELEALFSKYCNAHSLAATSGRNTLVLPPTEN